MWQNGAKVSSFKKQPIQIHFARSLQLKLSDQRVWRVIISIWRNQQGLQLATMLAWNNTFSCSSVCVCVCIEALFSLP